MVGFALGTAGYPFCLTLSASIFSKVVGGTSDPVSDHDNDSDDVYDDSFQAFWLGLFATAGSSARVAGPLLITEIYEQLGSYWMLGIVAILMVIRLDNCMNHN